MNRRQDVMLDPSLLLLLDPRTEPLGLLFRRTVSPTVLRALVARSRVHYRENVHALALLWVLREQAIAEAKRAPFRTLIAARCDVPEDYLGESGLSKRALRRYAASGGDAIAWSIEQEHLFVPPGATAELEDGTVVAGPAFLTGEARICAERRDEADSA